MINLLNLFFSRPTIFWLSAFFLAGFALAASAIYPSYLFNRISNYAVYILLLQFVAIFFFLTISKYRLMWIAIVCTGFLSLRLKNASNQHLILPSRSAEEEVTVSLYHVNAMTDLNTDLQIIKEDLPDILIFNEISPEWSAFLGSEFDSLYLFKIDLPRIDPFGSLLFTNHKVIKIDTLNYQNVVVSIPALSVLFSLDDGQAVGLTNIYNLPAINQSDYTLLGERLDEIATHLNRIEQVPWIVVADLNMASWVNEVSEFSAQLELQNSRRNSKLRKLPLDHIFFNSFFECYSFKEIENYGRYIGITGAYQVLKELKPQPGKN